MTKFGEVNWIFSSFRHTGEMDNNYEEHCIEQNVKLQMLDQIQRLLQEGLRGYELFLVTK